MAGTRLLDWKGVYGLKLNIYESEIDYLVEVDEPLMTKPETKFAPESLEIGQRIARQNAVQKIWPLMGYALKEKLSA